MKNLKRIFPLALLTLLVVTACNKDPVSTVGVAQEKTTQVQPASVNEGAPTVITSRYGTDMKCTQLKSTERRQECEIQLNEIIGSMLESEITSSFDIERCKELPGDMGARCQERLTEDGVKGPVSAEEIALFNEIRRGKQSEDTENPSTVYDTARCAELTAAGYKEYCEKRMAARADQEKMMQIMQSKDQKRCDELSTESSKNDCKQFFGVAVEEPVVAPVAEGTPATTPEGAPLNQ